MTNLINNQLINVLKKSINFLKNYIFYIYLAFNYLILTI